MLDRLTRSLKDLLHIMERVCAKLEPASEASQRPWMDTTSSAGRMPGFSGFIAQTLLAY